MRFRRLLVTLAACIALHPLVAQVATPAAVVPPTAAELKAAAQPTSDQTWWKHAVIYEIYPRSFQDSNGDGVGDLNGITQRLDYLQGLGVDAIWIAPMYPSPQVDFGYDISNYESVDPQYGTLADFDKLQAAAKQHNIRIILDMVLNHTSDKHAWFVESASSRDNPKADWYVWSNGVPVNSPGVTNYQKRFVHDGMVPPNNWISVFGGPAWEWVPARRQFYYHKFYKQQPDLNWRNPAVEKAMFDTMRFWLDRGVAGFRLDAITTLYEDRQLRNEPDLGGTNAQGDPNVSDLYTNMLPEVHDVLRRMRAMVDKYPGNRVLIGETYLPNTRELIKWYGTSNAAELHLPMDMLVGFHPEGGAAAANNVNLSLVHFRRFLTEMETQLGTGWPLLVFDNHDNTRSWDRFSTPSETLAQKQAVAKIIATMLYTTKATAMTYYGAEIGMVTSTPTRVEDVKDPIGITGWPKEKGRDGERTPMQWTPGPEAGFSTDPKTWLPVPASHSTINVQTETADPDSLLNWTKRLISLRRTNHALHDGGVLMINTNNAQVLSYVRTAPQGSAPVVVMMNMSTEPRTVALDLSSLGITASKAETLLSSEHALSGAQTLKSITLPPFESWVGTIQ